MRHTLAFGESLPSGAYANGMKKFSPLLMFFTNKSMDLYFVGEKHQRRRPFFSASRMIRMKGFCGFFWIHAQKSRSGARLM
jgi:hypothetical protein